MLQQVLCMFGQAGKMWGINMKHLKIEMTPLDVLAMLPSLGMMASSREEVEATGRVVAGALCRLVSAYPEAAEKLAHDMIKIAFDNEENEAAVKVIERACDSAVDHGYMIPLEE